METLHDTVDVIIKEAIKLDRKEIATALVTALEGIDIPHCKFLRKKTGRQIKREAITIVKELLTPTV